MKNIFGILVFILIIINNLSSQEIATTTSKNSRFFAVAKYDGKVKDTTEKYTKRGYKEKIVTYHCNTIDIYQINTLMWLRSFDFYSKSKEPVEEIGLSNDGILCYAKIGSNYAIWNIVTGELLYESEYVRRIGFSNQSAIFAVADFDRMYTYDAYTGNVLKKFNVSKSYQVDDITFTDDDKIIVVQTSEGRLFLLNTETGKSIKTFSADEIFFSNNNQTITTINIKPEKANSTQYSLPDYEKTVSFSSSTFLNELNKEMKNKTKEDNTIKYTPFEIKTDKTKISSDGKFLILYATFGDDEIIFCIDNQSYELVSYISSLDFASSETKVNFENYDIYDDVNLIIPYEDNGIGIYDIANGTIYNSLDYLFEESLFGYKFPIAKQIRTREISPNFKYVIVENEDSKKPVVFAQSTVIEQPASRIEGVTFIDYSPNSRYIFLKKKNGQLGYCKTMDIAGDLGDGTGLTFYPFGDSLIYPDPEDFIVDDAEFPDGYEFRTITDFKYIGDVEDDINIKLHLKTIAIEGDTAGIQVHLLDNEGVYYYGASEEQWQYVWKSLLIKSETSNQLYKIDTFKVQEYFGSDSLPNAVVIVLDHSGSMGTDRANQIQKAAKDFIENKNENDGVAIVKYDNKLGLSARFSTDKKQILKDFEINGLKGYGGCTSLLDAIDLAASVLDRAEGYNRKSILILTDGNENSSILTKGQVLKHSVGSNVNIYTIGFGSFVSEDYLKAIAFYTQGTYYQIYKTEQFDLIFNDIYKKMKYYYTIDFLTDTIGEFTTLLEIQLDDKRKDSLVTTFTNEPLDFEALDTEDEISFTPPVKEISIEEFKKEEIFEEFTVFADSIEVVEQMKQDSIKKEFEQIDFPDVQFVLNETVIIEGSEKGIDEVIDFMKKNPDITIEIQGHTDQTGTEEDNLKLSEDRANKVKQLLLDAGIDGDRIIAIGMGEAKLLSKSENENEKAKNRRVEFYIKSF